MEALELGKQRCPRCCFKVDARYIEARDVGLSLSESRSCFSAVNMIGMENGNPRARKAKVLGIGR